jgi:hypothetical protein
MNSTRLRYLGLLLLVLLLAGGLPACGARGGSTGLTIVITAPTNGAQFEEGEEVNILSSANDAKGVSRVELYVDGQLYSTDPNPDVETEPSVAMFQTWFAEDPGSHTLSVVAINVDGEESDPWAVTVTVVEAGGGVSPSPTSESAPPPTATTGTTPADSPVPPSPTPTESTAPSSAPAITYFRANGAEGSITVAAGTRVTLSWEWERVDAGYLDPGNVGMRCPAMPCTYDVTPGSTTTYTLRAVNSVGTAEASVTVQVEAAATLGPDLIVQNVAVTPPEVASGTSMEVAVDVSNVGDEPSGPFAALWEWGLVAGDVCEWEVESLSPGSGETLRCTVDEAIGVALPTVATVDWRGEVDESNEDNNSMELEVPIYWVVATPPELYISEIRIEPAERVQGSALHVGVRIHNDGDRDAAGFNVSWISGEPSRGCDWRVPSLAAGASRWQQCEYIYIGHGHFNTHAIVDVDDEIGEFDDDNNEAWLEIDVVHSYD